MWRWDGVSPPPSPQTPELLARFLLYFYLRLKKPRRFQKALRFIDIFYSLLPLYGARNLGINKTCKVKQQKTFSIWCRMEIYSYLIQLR
jgi:hypothetical protein